MRPTTLTDYGLRALMQSAPERAFSTAEVTEEFGVSREHLSKIMQRLGRGGIVETPRGSGASAVLANAPGTIRLGEFLRLLEQDDALVECFAPGGGACAIAGGAACDGPRRRFRPKLTSRAWPTLPSGARDDE